MSITCHCEVASDDFFVALMGTNGINGIDGVCYK